MGFKRVWDSSCPRVWDSWEADGIKWVISDLPPEDDEEALRILTEHMCTDETLCVLNGLVDDPVSLRSLSEFWQRFLPERTSLACYAEKDGQRKLVAISVCVIVCQDDDPHNYAEGRAWKNVNSALKLCYQKLNPFKLLGIDKILYARGLVVHREYRGAKLGSRLLAAREPLALHHGVYGSSTVCTGPASQVSAARAGFSTALTLTLKELAEAGLDYPKDENRCIKLMVKKYNGQILGA